MGFVFVLLSTLNFLVDFQCKLKQSHVMSIPDSDRYQIFAAFNINKTSCANFFRVLEVAPHDATNVSPNFVHTDCAGVARNVSHRYFDLLLLLIQLFNVGEGLFNIKILYHV